ncbi:RepB family plasmid replication initiator protein, partial [Kandleria vitulina]|uniref:RepB family plasmid replication initiator protein n=1 Tax=Kandleria vitulina TaxID=1630 RepID=UPI00332A437C
MSNTLAQKATRFTALQQRLFYVTLASLKQRTNSKNEVRIDKQELFEYLGMNMNDTYRWSKLRYQFKR